MIQNSFPVPQSLSHPVQSYCLYLIDNLLVESGQPPTGHPLEAPGLVQAFAHLNKCCGYLRIFRYKDECKIFKMADIKVDKKFQQMSSFILIYFYTSVYSIDIYSNFRVKTTSLENNIYIIHYKDSSRYKNTKIQKDIVNFVCCIYTADKESWKYHI